MKPAGKAILRAIIAAVCYGVSAPLSKFLLLRISPTFLAALLYLGAGGGMLLFSAIARKGSPQQEARITGRELPLVLAMIVLDIAAPILLMLGLNSASASTVSLLNNFEIVATSVIALVLFREAVGKRLWIAILVITLASILLSVEDASAFVFSPGALCALLACVLWGLENNCTRKLSLRDPLQVVIIKGLGSGAGALAVAALSGGLSFSLAYILAALLLGFFAYGLSIYFYVLAQRDLGAARTSAYYAFAPFVGVALSFMLFGQAVTLQFLAALGLMVLGACLAAFERHQHVHTHACLAHDHRHNHEDGHHAHTHPFPVQGEHSHLHLHEEITHTHPHAPDLHHDHAHQGAQG